MVTLLGVLAVTAAVGWVSGAFAAPAPPAPTITSGPTNPTSSASATFAFTDSQSGVTFQCSLDGAAFTACTSPKTYSGLGSGSHAFRVQAVAGNKTSSPASYSWTIDTTAPTLSSINRADANPTKANSLHWTVTFSEPVKNVVAGDFGLVSANLGGTAPFVSSVATSGSSPAAVWTVTISTTGTTGANNGSIELDLTSKGVSPTQIQDAAGNVLATTPPVHGQAYTFDTTPPPAPTLTSTPPDPQSGADASATFAWTDSEPGVNYLCSVDGGAYAVCTSPKSYSVNSLQQGQHTFRVIAVDAAGNQSAAASYTWNIVQPVKSFTISGSAGIQLYPGGAIAPLNLTIGNPNNYSVTVTGITVTVSSVTKAHGAPAGTCGATNFTTTNYTGNGFEAPSGSSTLQSDGVPQAQWPTVRMLDSGSSQDPCKGATVTLSYQGSAIK
jgi:hypothetical protein